VPGEARGGSCVPLLGERQQAVEGQLPRELLAAVLLTSSSMLGCAACCSRRVTVTSAAAAFPAACVSWC
jgi:hypothetical protein